MLAERDPDGRDAEDCRGPLLDLPESPRSSSAPRRRSAAMSASSAASRSRCSASAPRDPVPRRELPTTIAVDDVDGEREPVAAIGERERVDRRKEEEVEREHARDGDRYRERAAPEDRDEEDGEDVEHAEAEDRHDVVDKLDRDRDRLRPRARRLQLRRASHASSSTRAHRVRSVRLRRSARASR